MRHYSLKIPGLLLVVLVAAGCGISGLSSEEKRAEQARVTEQVGRSLDARRFKMDIEHMYPFRGASRYVGGDSYSLVVDGDKVRSHLPYMGVAYQVPYGGGKVLTFEDDIEEYGEGIDGRGRRVIAFSTDNDEDYIIFRLTVFDNGRADLQVRSRNREDINYRGSIDPDAFPEEGE